MRFLLVSALSLLIAGCTTPYQELGGGAVLGGVSAYQIGYDRYRVQAQVNAHTPPAFVADYLKLKSAETALKNGAEYFVVEDFADTTSVNSYALPGYVTCVYYSCVATPASMQHDVLPSAQIIIKLVRGKPPKGALSAREIIDTIGKRIRRS